MSMLCRAVLAVAFAAFPAVAQEVYEPDLGPDYPPKMGEIAGTLAGKPVAWETFDFSVGAFDASAWIGEFDGIYKMSLMAYPPGDPDRMEGRILIRAFYDRLPAAGDVPTNVEIIIPDGDDLDEGPRLSSQGNAADMVLQAISRDSYAYGRITGQVTARLCPRGGKTGGCRSLALTFDTSLQYDSIPES